MSLLLEALKKAEKAKEEAQRRAQEAGARTELRLESEAEPPAPPQEEAKPVLTRDNLPPITSQPLEILPDEPPAPKPAPARPESAPATAADDASRAAARKVFEAKFREPNPRMPFYIALGVLGAFALGTIVYFWYQLRPPPPLVNANPPPPANEAPVAIAQAPRPSVAPAATGTPAALPGLPGAAPAAEPPRASAAAEAARPAPAPEPPATVARPRPRAAAPAERPQPRAPRPAPRRAALAQAEPAFTPAARAAPRVHPRVQSAYAAYLAGDYATAQHDYEQALRDEPGNRDALLGLAALHVKAGRHEAAEGVYLRLLQANPRDAEAQAALIALRGERLDPLTAESRLKSLLAADPDAHVLHFTLGNQLAQQGRWAEAQAEYFKAYSAEPENPDFAYNLAVSLDHIRQPRLALEYYRRAIAAAGKRGGGFDLAAARRRVAELER